MIKDSLFKASSLVLMGTMVGNIFHYVFQITMGRMLTVSTFGEMNALLSVMVIFGVPFASITSFLVKNVATYDALSLTKRTNDLIIKSYKNLLAAGCIMFLTGAFFSSYLSKYLKIDSVIPVILLFLSIVASICIPINTGILQGLHKFKMLSFVSAGGGIFRYLLCFFLVYLGLGLIGVMIGIILTVVLIGVISFMPIANHLKLGREYIDEKYNNLLPVIIPIFIANLAFAILTQSDIILVKYIFTPHEAGIYSSAAIIGRTVMYLPGAIVISLFPMVASNKARDEGTLHLILKALAMTIALSGTGTLALYLFPDFIVSLFFGNRFSSAAYIIGLFAIAMLPMAFLMIIMHYNMAKGGKYFAYIMLLGSVMQVVGIVYFHDSLITVLKVMLISGSLCVTILFAFLTLEYYRGKLQSLVLSVKANK